MIIGHKKKEEVKQWIQNLHFPIPYNFPWYDSNFLTSLRSLSFLFLFLISDWAQFVMQIRYLWSMKGKWYKKALMMSYLLKADSMHNSGANNLELNEDKSQSKIEKTVLTYLVLNRWSMIDLNARDAPNQDEKKNIIEGMKFLNVEETFYHVSTNHWICELHYVHYAHF